MPHVDKAARNEWQRAYAKRRADKWVQPSPEELWKLFVADFDEGRLFSKTTGDPVGKTNLQNGYSTVYVSGKWLKTHRVLWAMRYGRWPDGVIDHINGRSFDNRIVNLREATQTANLANARLRKNNTLGIRGVAAGNGKWVSYLDFEGSRVHNATHRNLAHAVIARQKAVKKYFGEFASSSEWSNNSIMKLVRNARLLARHGCTPLDIAEACDCHVSFAQSIVAAVEMEAAS